MKLIQILKDYTLKTEKKLFENFKTLWLGCAMIGIGTNCVFISCVVQTKFETRCNFISDFLSG